MLCESPALSLLHLFCSPRGPQTASVKIAVSGAGTRLRLNALAEEDSPEQAHASF